MKNSLSHRLAAAFGCVLITIASAACTGAAFSPGTGATDGGATDGGATDSPDDTVLITVPPNRGDAGAPGDATTGDAGADATTGDSGSLGASDASAVETGNGCPASTPILCAGTCIDPMTSQTFCGAAGSCTDGGAGTVCGPTQTCSAGQCVCNAGLISCGGSCIDPETDSTYCGASGTCAAGSQGTTCTGQQACSSGSCVLNCLPPLLACGGACVDPQSDPNYCGSTACTDGARCTFGVQSCYNGGCIAGSTCPPNYVLCAGGCTLPGTSLLYCGASSNCAAGDKGEVCASDQVCDWGVCGPSCTAPLVLCGNSCADRTQDPGNCGFCGNKCTPGQQCVTGACH